MTNEEKLIFLEDILKIDKQEQDVLESKTKSDECGTYIKNELENNFFKVN